ncbi:chaplin family protein [Actinomadura sp. GC306]|uniref:chaplin family protein n=1 Tax=Actinomadura sp. GC306 TaxID=2530367 RepID=UPI001404C5B3|nr:chaplin family protein [Actinomadura sp. GC306]
MIKKLAATGILGFAVAASALAAAPAQAAAFGGGNAGDGSHNTTAGNIGLLAGNQVIAPISAATTVCGNAVAVIGLANAQCKGVAEVDD